MSRPLDRLLRVRRLMEEMSRAEFAARRMKQAELERRQESAQETALALRGEARAKLAAEPEAGQSTPGVWQRLMDDSDKNEVRADHWARAAARAAEQTGEAERRYLDERRSRMQAEIVVRERAAAERMERERREQREIDDWFGMGRGRRGRKTCGYGEN